MEEELERGGLGRRGKYTKKEAGSVDMVEMGGNRKEGGKGVQDIKKSHHTPY